MATMLIVMALIGELPLAMPLFLISRSAFIGADAKSFALVCEPKFAGSLIART